MWHRAQLKLAAIAFVNLAVAAVTPARADSSTEVAAVRLVEELAQVMEANKADCDKMGDALAKFMDSHTAEIRRLREEEKKMTEEQKKAIANKYAARLQAAAAKILAGAQACGSNPKVKDALGHFKP
jgi:hypothetical protein